MKTKDLSTASVASDSPNTRHGQAQHYEDSCWRKDVTELLIHYLAWNPNDESLQMRLHKTVSAVKNVERLTEAANSNAKAYQDKYDECEHALQTLERLAEALKMLRISSQACFDDILATGSISHENGSFYRRDRESSKVALVEYEKGKQQ